MAEKRPFNVRCGSCEHEWALAYLPMPVDKIVAITKRATCPACGETHQIFIAAEPATHG